MMSFEPNLTRPYFHELSHLNKDYPDFPKIIEEIEYEDPHFNVDANIEAWWQDLVVPSGLTSWKSIWNLGKKSGKDTSKKAGVFAKYLVVHDGYGVEEYGSKKDIFNALNDVNDNAIKQIFRDEYGQDFTTLSPTDKTDALTEMKNNINSSGGIVKEKNYFIADQSSKAWKDELKNRGLLDPAQLNVALTKTTQQINKTVTQINTINQQIGSGGSSADITRLTQERDDLQVQLRQLQQDYYNLQQQKTVTIFMGGGGGGTGGSSAGPSKKVYDPNLTEEEKHEELGYIIATATGEPFEAINERYYQYILPLYYAIDPTSGELRKVIEGDIDLNEIANDPDLKPGTIQKKYDEWVNAQKPHLRSTKKAGQTDFPTYIDENGRIVMTTKPEFLPKNARPVGSQAMTKSKLASVGKKQKTPEELQDEAIKTQYEKDAETEVYNANAGVVSVTDKKTQIPRSFTVQEAIDFRKHYENTSKTLESQRKQYINQELNNFASDHKQTYGSAPDSKTMVAERSRLQGEANNLFPLNQDEYNLYEDMTSSFKSVVKSQIDDIRAKKWKDYQKTKPQSTQTSGSTTTTTSSSTSSSTSSTSTSSTNSSTNFPTREFNDLRDLELPLAKAKSVLKAYGPKTPHEQTIARLEPLKFLGTITPAQLKALNNANETLDKIVVQEQVVASEQAKFQPYEQRYAQLQVLKAQINSDTDTLVDNAIVKFKADDKQKRETEIERKKQDRIDAEKKEAERLQKEAEDLKKKTELFEQLLNDPNSPLNTAVQSINNIPIPNTGIPPPPTSGGPPPPPTGGPPPPRGSSTSTSTTSALPQPVTNVAPTVTQGLNQIVSNATQAVNLQQYITDVENDYITPYLYGLEAVGKLDPDERNKILDSLHNAPDEAHVNAIKKSLKALNKKATTLKNPVTNEMVLKGMGTNLGNKLTKTVKQKQGKQLATQAEINVAKIRKDSLYADIKANGASHFNTGQITRLFNSLTTNDDLLIFETALERIRDDFVNNNRYEIKKSTVMSKMTDVEKELRQQGRIK